MGLEFSVEWRGFALDNGGWWERRPGNRTVLPSSSEGPLRPPTGGNPMEFQAWVV